MARRVAKAPILPIPNELAQPVAPTEQLAMVSPSGDTVQVPAEQAGTLAGLGYKQLTPELSAKQAEEAKYGEGIVNELEAAGLGILRGSTLGLSDLALRKINPEWADSAAKLKEYNPDASLAGELGSFALPMLGGLKVLGTAGKAAKATGLLQSLVSTGGEGLGKIATKIVGENLAGRVAASAINMAAQSAVYQAAHNISEDALGDRDLTAESIMANTGQAAVLGLGWGAAVPLAAAGVQALANTAPVRAVISGATKQALKFFDPDRSLQLYSGAMGNGKLLRDTLEGNKFKDSVSFMNDRGLYQSGEVALDPAKRNFVKVAGGGMPTGPEAYQRLINGQQAAMNELDTVLTRADTAIANNPELQVMLQQFPQDAEKALRKQIEDVARTQINVSADHLNNILDQAIKLYGQNAGSLKGLNELKRGLYDGINYNVAGKAEIRLTKDIARTVKEAVEKAADVAVPGSGEAIKDLNKLWGSMETIRQPLDALLQKSEANVNVFGLRWRDMLAGVGGGFAGGAVGGPVGAAAGLGLGAANKVLQTDAGLLMRAEIGQKIQRLAWAEQIMKKSSAEISDSIKGFLGKADAGAIAAEGVKKFGAPIAYALSDAKQPDQRVQSQQNWFDETRKAILAVARDPQTFAAKQGDELQGFASAAPGVANAMLNKQLQVYDYLAGVMPKNPGMPLNITNDPWKPADYEVQRFRKIVQVARAPLTILQDLKAGTLTGDQVQAVKTLYPRLYEQILGQVREQITAPDAKATYHQRLKLGMMFQGTEPTMDPAFVMAMQTPTNKPDEPSNRIRPPGGRVQLSKNTMTATERAANRP